MSSPTIISASSAVNTGGGYPQLADLKTYLTDAQISGLSDTSLQAALDAAIERWEDETHFVPFYSATASASVLRQNPPRGRYLELETPFRSISEVKTGVSPQSVGVAAVQGLDFEWVYFRRGRVTCIEAIDFGGRWFAGVSDITNSVQITGLPGVTDSLPKRVFQLILQEAARVALLTLKSGSSLVAAGVVKAITQGPIKVEYTTGAEGASSSSQTRARAWEADWQEGVCAWARRVESLGGGW